MEIERIDSRDGGVEVVTTGVRLRFSSKGEIEGRARIPVERTLWVSDPVEGPAAPWVVTTPGPPVCLQREGGGEAEVTEDGVLRLRTSRGWRVTPGVEFEPLSIARSRGRWLILDRAGGFSVQPEGSSRAERVRWHRDGLELGVGRTWIGTYPPRWPRAEHLDWGIAHEGRPQPFPESVFPDADVVAESAKTCRVLALHAYFWKAAPRELRPRWGRYAGRRCSWLTPRHEPEHPERYWAFRESVRRHGLKLVVYLSPYYCHAPDIEDEVARVLEEYDVDGLYLDGVADTMPEAYRIVRGIRTQLGPDRLLYLNATRQPLDSVQVACPFIDAWADFVLRGDSGRGGWSRNRFLDWAVRAWGVSNAVSFWCHYGSWGGPFPRDRVPQSRDVSAALERHVRIWRRSFWPGAEGRDRFDREHGEGLTRLAASERAWLEESLGGRDSGD